MATPVTLTYGKVKYPALEPRQTSRGLRINVVIVLENGEEVKLWGDPGDNTLTPLIKNQRVALVKNSKNNWQIVENRTQAFDSNEVADANKIQQKEKLTIEEKAKIVNKCLIAAYNYCGEMLKSENSLVNVALFLAEKHIDE